MKCIYCTDREKKLDKNQLMKDLKFPGLYNQVYQNQELFQVEKMLNQRGNHLDPNTSRVSHIYGSMNSIYYVDPNSSCDQKYIRVKGQQDNMHEVSKFTQQSFNSQIEVSPLTAWILLFISVLFSAFVPCWLLADVKSEPLTRNSWRYFIVSLLAIPFMLYEQRTIKEQSKKFFKLLTTDNLKPIFLDSLNYTIWLTILIYACQFTSFNHALCFSQMRFFLISLIKMIKKERIHEFEIAGTILCSIGIILVMSDSLTLPQSFNPADQRWTHVQLWKRFLLGDCLGFSASLFNVYFHYQNRAPQMPRFTYLYLYNAFLTFNLVTFGYFFGGSQFSFNTKFGVFGLFTYDNFVSVFYVSIMLGLYLMIVNILTSQIFNDVIVNAGFRFELILTSLAWHGLGLERMPANMTCLGYAFITPGLIFNIGGQGTLQNKGHKMEFELYRPTEVRDTYIESVHGGHSLDNKEISFDKSYEGPIKEKGKGLEKKPFEMILQEDETDVKNKNQ